MTRRTGIALAALVVGYLGLYVALNFWLPQEWVTGQLLWFGLLSLILLAASKPITALASWAGLTVGVMLGELIGGALYRSAMDEFQRNPQDHTHLPFHYGWLIAIGSFLVGVIGGYLGERRLSRSSPAN